jgi:hypothetical protein
MGQEEGVALVELCPTNEEYKRIVHSYAWVCYKKIKKPSVLQFEDLISEGMVILLRAIKSFNPKRGYPFEPFLKKSLAKSLSTIVSRSYRTIDRCGLEAIQIDKRKPVDFSPQKIVLLTSIPQQLSKIECEYLCKLIDPSSFIQEIVGLSTSKIKARIKKQMGLDSKEAKLIEQKIQDTIW